MKPFELDPRANQEAIEAADWYEPQAGLGNEFLSAVARAIEQACLDSTAQERIRGAIQRRRVLLFPYDVILIDKPNFIRVIAIAHHHHRHPGYWRQRPSN